VIGHTDKIAVATEKLQIGYKKIMVDDEFVDESSKGIGKMVSIPLPVYPTTANGSAVI
jgi:hypothetical protein